MKKLNIALFGYKFMGKAHSNAWRQVGHFFDVPIEPVMKVICGRSEPDVKDAAVTHGWAEYSTSWQEVIGREDIDVMDICTPGDSHMEIAVAAANSKKVVLCEKPLANTLPEAAQMLHAVRANGVINMVCHNYRRAPAVALARQFIDEGQIGSINHFRGTYLQDWIIDPDFPLVWRLQKARSGSGAMGDLSSHVIDLARYLVGEITEAAGLMKTFINERPLVSGGSRTGVVDVDDATLAMVKFENGAIGTIESSRMAPGHKNHACFEINGSRGSISFDLERINELELYIDDGPNSGFRTIKVTESSHPYIAAWWPPGHVIGYEHTFIHMIYDLIKAIDEHKSATPNFEDGWRNQKVMDAIERASQTRKWETV